jgi:Na+-driven multidrug efflux pump
VGLFVPLIIVAWFKWRYAPTNDLVAAATSSDIRQRLLDGSRYLKVAGTFLYGLVGYGDGLVAALPLVALVLGRRAQGAHRSVVALATTIVMLMACGYVLIYILSPHDLDWHLRTSLKRLILHLYPSMLFAFFVFVDSPSAATPTAARGAATSG